MRLPTVVIILYIAVALVGLLEARRGGRGRGSTRSRSRSSNRRSSSSGGSSSRPEITKYTPIRATTVRSPVIFSQTKLGTRSSALKSIVAAYLVYRYALNTAPVYRSGYPMYRSYISIPKNRAVRVSYEKVTLLDSNGYLCLGQSSKIRKLRDGLDDKLIELKTTVTYKRTGVTETYYDDTVSLEDINEQDFEVISLGRYNTTIVEGTNCTQVEKGVEGTMVTLYETNPNYEVTEASKVGYYRTSRTYSHYSRACSTGNLLATTIALLGVVYVPCVLLANYA